MNLRILNPIAWLEIAFWSIRVHYYRRKLGTRLALPCACYPGYATRVNTAGRQTECPTSQFTAFRFSRGAKSKNRAWFQHQARFLC